MDNNPLVPIGYNEANEVFPPAPGCRGWLITKEQLDIARHDFNIPRGRRSQIMYDHDVEFQAARTRCRDGRTIKEVVDDLVFNKYCINWVWSGKYLYVSHADERDRYQLSHEYADYLRVAIRWMNPIAMEGGEIGYADK